MPVQTVRIQTGCRLHFGPLSHRPERGRHFGGIGMMVKNPGFLLVAKLSDSDGEPSQEQAAGLLARIQANCPEWKPIAFELVESIPGHVGLGSGTQLGMALSEAMGILHGETELTAQRLASYSRRGQRSSIGLHGYMEGGFLVDAGHRQEEVIGQIACRYDFPEDWRILLVTPEETTGMHGDDETLTFAKLSPMSQARTGELSRLTLTEILPSLKHSDFESFSKAIRAYGELVGEFFSSTQGGDYSHPEMEPFVNRLSEQGVRAIAQSSWGPTVSIFAKDESEAERIFSLIKSDESGQRWTVRITSPMNHGRVVSVD
ncbi:hypothetical protein [Thalassoglobus sp.]|uniref:GHMP family kinase ATP-binding protein n=1 Tax=Thalassoglobus sp. TaxID=2795869 RepID=UPI003AA8EC5F